MHPQKHLSDEILSPESASWSSEGFSGGSGSPVKPRVEIVTRDETRIATLKDLSSPARVYISASRSPRTREAYRWQFERFARWCEELELSALPAEPETVGILKKGIIASYVSVFTC